LLEARDAAWRSFFENIPREAIEKILSPEGDCDSRKSREMGESPESDRGRQSDKARELNCFVWNFLGPKFSSSVTLRFFITATSLKRALKENLRALTQAVARKSLFAGRAGGLMSDGTWIAVLL
jgi:hypothetical protein